MRKLLIIICCILLHKVVFSQTDTIKPALQKLLTKRISSSAARYVVYWEDKKGNVAGPIDLWQRELQIKGKTYFFNWKWYRNDTLYTSISTNGNSVTMEPFLHQAEVNLNPPAFAFPMDLEILPLLPFKRVGQKFVIPFYEPGSKQSAFYNATLIRKDQLPLHGSTFISCWVLRLDYAPNSYAEFWIADKKRQVMKMREFYQGKYRYKVKLY